ncbi:MAG: S1C family serine protease [Candidatus Paceibacterota bacterium]
MEEIKIHSLRDRQKEKMEKAENFFQKKMDMEEVPRIEIKRKKNTSRRIVKFFLLTVFVFFVGGMGGVWIDRILLPTVLVKYPELNQYEYLKRVNERTTIVRETQEINISQEDAASDAIEKTRPTVAEVFAKNDKDVYMKIGTGVILTSDGYLITPLKNIYTEEDVNEDLQIKLKNDQTYTAEIIAQDTNYNLAILKISENNLPVIPYADVEDLKLGQKLIIVDDAVVTDLISKMISDYVMPLSTDSGFQERIQIVQNLDVSFAGAPVINLEGKLVGVEQEANLIIPISEIKDFIEKSTGA